MKPGDLIMQIFRLPAWLSGASFNQFSVLLKTRLVLDGRTEYITLGSNKNRTFIFQLLILFFFGLLFGLLLFSRMDFQAVITFFFTAMMFITGMVLITEYTNVLFDSRDNYIILPRPISRRTLLFSRIIHIQLYSGIITLAFSLTMIFLIGLKYNLIVSIVFLVAVMLLSWLTVWTTIILYLLVSKLFQKEKFKDVVNYLQIIMAVVFTFAYHLINRIDSLNFSEIINPHSWLSYLVPTFWFGAVMNFAVSGFTGIDTYHSLMIILSLVTPLLCVLFLLRFLANGYDRILSSLDAESSEKIKTAPGAAAVSYIRDTVCNSPFEKAGWNIVMACTARDRKFKTYLYPGMFSMVLLGILMMIPGFIRDSETLSELGFFTGVIMAGMSGVLVFKQLLYTGTPAAAWVYSVVPLKMRAKIFTGSMKAVFLKFFLPVHLLVISVTILLTGFSKLLYALTGLLGTYLLSIIINFFQRIDIPYTKSYEMFDKGEITVTGMVVMILAVLLVGLVYITTILPAWVLLIVIPTMTGFSVLILKRIGSGN